ncbi:E3 ubiquitin-protein ligase MIB2-like [Physella acuta]|uniref:E3 ubiquitin-protein ligase MIB2-like n=1 Tax=Physella acuta TaxID=109671 RepID=UPI0027DC7573|nr:E3 ubiquitin-protein ligase MIB2-like [Physella acuta]
MADKHDVRHEFQRLCSPRSDGVVVGKRCNSKEKKTAMGLFVGATVCRGCDWRWGNQDGGSGTEGMILNIDDWGEDSFRSKATVLWPSRSINNYRLGHNGSMDLRCIKPSKGGSYYKDHLPVLGKIKEKKMDDLLASVLARGLLGESLLGPMHKMFMMHQMLGALRELQTTDSSADEIVGTRVVRGPDWSWQNQDGGVGHVGTVVKVNGGGSGKPEQTVDVVWDNGQKNMYRIGINDKFDLLVFDNAPSGVRHAHITCDECKTEGVRGIRWKCSVCTDFDLCTVCYLNDKHSKDHRFIRIARPDDRSVLVPSRSSSSDKRVQSRGIFKGATVVRGLNWEYGEQDGTEGTKGKVEEIINSDNDSGRGIATVTWSLSTRVYKYRVGHKGQVDLKYLTPGIGQTYYTNHLPVLGKVEEQYSWFKVGDPVMCVMPLDALKKFQEKHGGWNNEMAKYINKKGTVCDVDDDGDIQVVYEDRQKWCFNPEALVKVEVKRLTVDVMMKDDIVKHVLDLDIPEDLVKKTLTKRLAETGMQFESSEALTEAILKEHCGGAVASGTKGTDAGKPKAKLQADSNLDQENQFTRQQHQCKICMDSEAVITFVPCGHLSCCGTCAAAITDCPICRSRIESRIRTFVA